MNTPRKLAIVTGVAVGSTIGMAALLVLLLSSPKAPSLTVLQNRGSRGGERFVDASAASVDGSRRNAIVAATERVSPAVVSVVALRRAANFRRHTQLPPAFERFFRAPGPRRSDELEAYSYGSGCVLHEAGYVLTNEHVIRGADAIVVTLQDGQDLSAEVVGQTSDYDLAVLKISGEVSGMAVAPFGSSEDLQIGEWAIAIGTPYGYLLEDTSPTVTVGVISGLNRSVKRQQDLSTMYFDMIQTDAAIHPGNSGGPLVNSNGEVIGINTFLLEGESGGGLGFAVPIDRCLWVMDEILRHGYFRKPYYGMAGTLLTSHAVTTLNLPSNTPPGWLVTEVQRDSPAAAAGVQPGDVVITVNGAQIATQQQLTRQLLGVRVENEVGLGLWREGQRVDTTITPSEDPSTDRS